MTPDRDTIKRSAYQDFSDYMSVKRQKTQLQNSNLNSSSLNPIFKGITLYFNGLVGSLTMLDLKQQVLKRGAIVKDYLASDTTHIIASCVIIFFQEISHSEFLLIDDRFKTKEN